MIIYVDVSIYAKTPACSVGHVSGKLELAAVPFIGSSVSFAFPPTSGALPVVVPGFLNRLKVTDVWYVPRPGDCTVGVNFEDVVLESRTDAIALMSHLEAGFGLVADEH